MNIVVKPSVLHGSVYMIASKSLSHRYLIGAALSEEPSMLHGLMESNDIQATKNALSNLGAVIDGCSVQGGFPHISNTQINAGASGSTVRFLIPVALLQDKPVVFTGEQRLPERSLRAYETLFTAKGYTYERLTEKHLPVRIGGPLKPGIYEIGGGVSSQFISGLLFALPLLDGNSEIRIIQPFESRSYVKLTIAVLDSFGIKIEETTEGFLVPGNQKYQPLDITVEGDYSQAAFFIVAGLIGKQSIKLKHLNPDSLQGDRRILEIVATMGAKLTWSHQVLEVHPSHTKGTDIDLADIPDLGPPLMLLAALSEGTTIFHNIKRLRYKESDRVAAMQQVLNTFGVTNIVSEETMTIKGSKTLNGDISLDSYDDHRIAMTVIIASLRCGGDIELTRAATIEKSYPDFIDVFKRLGGQVRIKKEGKKDEFNR